MTGRDTQGAMRVRDAAGRLGLPFLGLVHLIEYDPEADTAFWAHNTQTGHESVHVGPTVAFMEIDDIEMVLRHEFLHRSTYNGFHERYPDHQLANIVEDICINRLLYESYPDKMRSLSEKIYPEEAKTTVIALADCSANPDLLEPDLAALWRHVWTPRADGTFPDLNPASLYYRLLDVKEAGRLNDLGQLLAKIGHLRHASDLEGVPVSSRVASALPQVLGKLAEALGNLSEFGRTLSEYLNVPVRLGTTEVTEFLSRIQADRLASDASTPIREFARHVQNQVYPGIPSRKGLTLLTTGLSEMILMYSNVVTETRPTKLALCMYVDVSGSMTEHLRYLHVFIKAVVQVPLKVKLFDTTVQEVEPEDVIAGNVRVGGGTDFNCVLQDLIEDDDVGSGVIFTDGGAGVSPGLADRVRQAGKLLYGVYFGSGRSPKSPLSAYLQDWIVAYA